METSSKSAVNNIGRQLLDTYFKTNAYPYTRHHIDSYDQFLQKDLGLIIKSHNPILILEERIGDTSHYQYRTEISIGGKDASGIYIGSPTVALQDTDEVRLMYPAEARLRNLTYSSTVYTDIYIKIIRTNLVNGVPVAEEPIEILEPRYPLFKIPIMLHSRYCVLHKKPKDFLIEAGECQYDHGGYFIIQGGEKVLITMQQQAFNTLYISEQESDPDYSSYATITSFSPESRITKRVSFGVDRKTGAIVVSLPFIRMPIPLFVLFRALGVQSDQDIVESIFPDLQSPEAQLLMPHLVPSVSDAYPYLTTFTAIQFMKTFTKGYSEAHVLDVLYNQVFIHVDNSPGAKIHTLGNYVRQLLRVVAGIDKDTDKDNIQNQRCLVSGFSTQMLFQGIYNIWKKSMAMAIDKEYNFNKKLYSGASFANIFASGNINRLFMQGYITDGLLRAFRGKWGTGLGEDKAGLIQVLSRLSYLDFMSHCRRVVLDFDTGLKLTGPRHLHPSQFGYFCTNETPGGSSIGITKNLSILTMISTGMILGPFLEWLRKRRFILPCEEVNSSLRARYVTVEINAGIVGYTAEPDRFVRVLQLLKRTGWLPPFISIGFNRQQRRVFIYTDEGRPLRPLVIVHGGKLPVALLSVDTWRNAVLGSDPERAEAGLDTSEFVDPLAAVEIVTLNDYLRRLEPYEAPIEYIDPYEQNLSFIATFPDHILAETTHMEIHPSTMLGVVNSTIPFLNHNQSPRNQLGCSQSKQGVSLYCSNWKNRFDNQVHVLCYPQAPLVTTHYQRYFSEGRLNNGFNCIVALGTYAGYNQEDGIVMNADSVKRGMFRSICYRTYEAFEENDKSSKSRFGNPREVAGWNDIRPNLDYSKLDERGFIRVGEYVDEETVIAGKYILVGSQFRDDSLTPQVWTRGRVDEVVVLVGANGLRTVKIRIVQDRSPEIGDKFTNRHGQKGTIGMLIRADNLPRTADGIVPDIIMNPHAIPSRMTIAQIMEQILGKSSSLMGYLGDGTAFTNEGSPADRLGAILEAAGAEKFGNEILYNGITGEQMPAHIFMCPLYNMRLKHMVEDKWNARGEGRREQRTHQPTGGRGNQGGLKIGELERDTIVCHGITEFLTESLMKRSDGTTLVICNGCGKFPIYNEKLGIKICPTCDGPVKFVGDTSKTLEIVPPLHQSRTTFSKVEAPYVTRLLSHEMETFMNMPLRFLTSKEFTQLKKPEIDPLIEGPAELPTLPELQLMDQREVEIVEEEEDKINANLEKPGAEELGIPIPVEMTIQDELAPIKVSTVAPPMPPAIPPRSSESEIGQSEIVQPEIVPQEITAETIIPDAFAAASGSEGPIKLSTEIPVQTELPVQASLFAPPASQQQQQEEGQLYEPVVPGTPSTFVVDTGLDVNTGLEKPPAFGNFEEVINRSRNNSRSRATSNSDEGPVSSTGTGSSSASTGFAKVIVNKLG